MTPAENAATVREALHLALGTQGRTENHGAFAALDALVAQAEGQHMSTMWAEPGTAPEWVTLPKRQFDALLAQAETAAGWEAELRHLRGLLAERDAEDTQ